MRSGEAKIVGDRGAQDGSVLCNARVGAVLFGAGSAERARIYDGQRRARGDGVVGVGVAEIETRGDAAAVGHLVIQAAERRRGVVRRADGALLALVEADGFGSLRSGREPVDGGEENL